MVLEDRDADRGLQVPQPHLRRGGNIAVSIKRRRRTVTPITIIVNKNKYL